MGVFSDLFRQLWPQGINNITRGLQRTSDWLKTCDFELDRPITSDNDFLISNYNRRFLETLAYEINRMSCAALESVIECDLNRLNKKAIAWTIIRGYFGAYYAAHCILRILGNACVYIDASICNNIYNMAHTYFPNQNKKPKSGYYHLEFNTTSNSIEFICDTNKKGSHHFMWKIFYNKINKIIDYSKNKGEYWQPVIVGLLNLSDVLRSDGCNSGNWLSLLRNEVNYHLKNDVWYPYTNLSKREAKIIISRIRLEKDTVFVNLAEDDSKYMKFANSVSFFITLMIELLIDLDNRNISGKSFLKKDFFYLLKIIRKERIGGDWGKLLITSGNNVTNS